MNALLTLEQFLERLAAVPCEWELTELGRIRSKYAVRIQMIRGQMCPISALGRQPAFYFDIVGVEIGLAPWLAKKIVKSSDNHAQQDKDLRNKLLKACRLETP